MGLEKIKEEGRAVASRLTPTTMHLPLPQGAGKEGLLQDEDVSQQGEEG